MPITYPVIVVPGVTGTALRDEYPFPPDSIWGTVQHDFSRVALHPNNTQYEVIEPARVTVDGLLDVAYKELIHELRYNLREREDQPVPVYAFGYDWRQPLEFNVALFAAFVQEVIDRTRLLRHYARAGYDKDARVNLVGHSMGGLIITGYLARAGVKAPVVKVVTLATPFRGSFEAVIKVATGTAVLGTAEDSSSRERDAARLTPSLYQILPAVPNALEITDPALAGKDLFDPDLWQRGVLETITQYVRMHGIPNSETPAVQAKKLFSRFLKAGADHQAEIENFRLNKTPLKPADWLCVAGINAITRVRLKISNTRAGPIFDLGSTHRVNNWGDEDVDPALRHLTGDGTVPFDSAVPPFLRPVDLVCVVPDDYGYWEVKDRLLAVDGVAGFHAIIPNMDMLHRLVVRHLTDDGRPSMRSGTWGWPAPGVSDAEWEAVHPGLRNKQPEERTKKAREAAVRNR